MRNKTASFLSLILTFGLLFSDIALGKVLFKDDFEAETIGKEPSKWTYVAGPQTGEIIKDPKDPQNKVFSCPRQASGAYGNIYVVGENTWTDYIAEWDWMMGTPTNSGNFALVFRFQDQDHYYQVSARTDRQSVDMYARDNGWAEIVVGNFPTPLEKWFRIQLVVKGNTYSYTMKEKSDDTPFAALGVIGKATDSMYGKGQFGTESAGYIDNLIMAESEADILAVEPADKLATTWGRTKAGYGMDHYDIDRSH